MLPFCSMLYLVTASQRMIVAPLILNVDPQGADGAFAIQRGAPEAIRATTSMSSLLQAVVQNIATPNLINLFRIFNALYNYRPNVHNI